MIVPEKHRGFVQAPVEALAVELARHAGGGVRAILLYGSHLLRGTAPDRHSAVDFVVIVDDYDAFYRALHAEGELPRPPSVMAALAHVLPPNVIAFAPDEGRSAIAKCLVVRADHFERALGPHARDHFLLGRLVQKTAVVWARDPAQERWVRERLSGAYSGVLEWLAPYLESPFDSRSMGRRLLEVCYRGELRPEAGDRAEQIFLAQVDHFESVLEPVLERAVGEGRLEGHLDGYRFVDPPTAAERRRWRRHFRRSKVRSTARWLKHTITFANWLPYVVRKVERHTGREIRLTTLERRLPLIFLWPRTIYVLLTKPPRRDG